LAAIVIGTVFGVMLGLSRWGLRPRAQQPSIEQAQAKVVMDQIRSASIASLPAPISSGLSKAAANAAAAMQTVQSTMSEAAAVVFDPKLAVPSIRPSAPPQNKVSAPFGAKSTRVKTPLAVSSKVGSTRTATEGPKPKYSGDDLD
jgi:hypothetical protein